MARHDMNPDSHHISYWAFTHANSISFPNLEFYAMSCLPTTFCSVIIGPDVAARASASGDNTLFRTTYLPLAIDSNSAVLALLKIKTCRGNSYITAP